jgi:hypothetical protein
VKQGYLSQYFDGIAIKHLSAVEADTLTSNQHEFNGVKGLRAILGEPDGKVRYQTKFLYLTDNDDEPITEDGFLTWYDARQRARLEHQVMRWEYRLYFPTNTVSQYANAGDLLVIAKQQDGTLLAIVAENETTIASQITWLFGLSNLSHPGFSIREELETEQDRIEFISRFILENIGITVEATEETWLDDMLEKFNGTFPTTRIFSAYARSTLPEVSPQTEQDDVLMAWLEREEILFRTLEKHLIGERLRQGFDDDVDSFISFSLSVQNRRKSRAGLAVENHLETLFQECDICYTRTPTTEHKAKPDFIFPGIEEYRDDNFNSSLLTMLGVKSSCKDRWRQVLSEAYRIENKHLLTLEASISLNQTNEMQAKNLQLVVPQKVHETYQKDQQSWLMSLADFTEILRQNQL